MTRPRRRPPGGWLPLGLALILMLAVVGQSIVLSLVVGRLRPPGFIPLVAMLVALTVLIAVVTTWQGWLGRRSTRGTIEIGIDRRNRKRLLTIVRARAANQLEQSFSKTPALRLRMTMRPHVVEFPSELLVRVPEDDRASELPLDGQILEVYDRFSESLLVLGAPGAGKSTVLAQLTKALVDRAEADQMKPIPVLVSLASWAGHRGSLENWLGKELSVVYGVHQRLGTSAAMGGLLLPVLDGLDEIAATERARCVDAINAYQRDQSRPDRQLTPIVVSSRLAEAETLTRPLQLLGAVHLEPLTDEQVVEYLEAADAREMLTVAQADEELGDLLHSPLILNIAALTARDQAIDALQRRSGHRLEALLDAYIDTMLTAPDQGGRRRAELSAWPNSKIRAWLTWLASSMSEHSLTEFHLERLQPTWLKSAIHREIVRVAPAIVWLPIVALASFATVRRTGSGIDGVIVALVAGPALLVAVFGQPAAIQPTGALHLAKRSSSVRMSHSIIRGGLLGGLLGLLVSIAALISGGMASFSEASVTVATGLVVGTIAAALAGALGAIGVLLSGLLVGSAAGLLSGSTDLGLALSWFSVLVGGLAIRIRGAERGLILGGLVGVIVGAVLAGLVPDLEPWRVPLAGGFVGGLAGGLLGSLLGLVESAVAHPTSKPNQGIHRSARQSLLVAASAGTVLGLVFWLITAPNSAVFGTAGGLAGSIFGGLVYGGNTVIRHYVVRFLAITRGVTPTRYVRFLDAAADGLLLLRTGAGYRFPHYQLQERFSLNTRSRPVAASPTRPMSG